MLGRLCERFSRTLILDVAHAPNPPLLLIDNKTIQADYTVKGKGREASLFRIGKTLYLPLKSAIAGPQPGFTLQACE